MMNHPGHSIFFAILAKEAAKKTDFARWAFTPGMLFGAGMTWWNNGLRQSPHEGLDLGLFLDRAGKRHMLSPETMIPAAYAGSVIKIIPDFMGHTIIMEHKTQTEARWRLCSLYGHTVPTVQTGEKLPAGAALGCMAPGKAAGPPPHIHLTLAWLSPILPAAELSWKMMRNPSLLELIDPMSILPSAERSLLP